MADGGSRTAGLVQGLYQPEGAPRVDFRSPAGEPALAAPDSVSWRVFKNPVSLFVGGVTAVILELAEPRVRTGVWEHSSFRRDPLPRLKRTGLAAMVTVYGARSTAEKMIAGVRRMHDRVTGDTPAGAAYRANDVELLDWVQATASFGFMEAYHAYARPLSAADRDRFYTEAAPAAALYGAVGAPASVAEWEAQLAAMLPKLERHEIVFEFLDLMRKTAILPGPLGGLQGALIRAAVAITPAEVRAVVGLGPEWDLGPVEGRLVRLAGAAADRIPVKGTPAVEACQRMGLRSDYLYRR
ncbi:oxygenase MpaB family protein [Caulobacter sp. UNC358MFTsu5.1]|uniref:oxygenase MpaB family protein n=1 Tax=Caulobacter sp. UNC358MFTsu5.1 TaxID=1449049 RepID=UPI0004A77DE9|nr:oxygenase MpaB family protein [Caulobacter sp. UNC358MFTsu5.1]